MTNIYGTVLSFLPFLLCLPPFFNVFRAFFDFFDLSRLFLKPFSHLSDCLITDLEAFYVVKVSFGVVDSYILFSLLEITGDC